MSVKRESTVKVRMTKHGVLSDHNSLATKAELTLSSFSHLRYPYDACMDTICICRIIHSTIHASSVGAKEITGRESLVYGW